MIRELRPVLTYKTMFTALKLQVNLACLTDGRLAVLAYPSCTEAIGGLCASYQPLMHCYYVLLLNLCLFHYDLFQFIVSMFLSFPLNFHCSAEI